jgi:hypothetical protein
LLQLPAHQSTASAVFPHDRSYPGIGARSSLHTQASDGAFDSKSTGLGDFSRSVVANMGPPGHSIESYLAKGPIQDQRQRSVHDAATPRPRCETETDLRPRALLEPKVDRPGELAFELNCEGSHGPGLPASCNVVKKPESVGLGVRDRHSRPALTFRIATLLDDSGKIFIEMPSEHQICSVGQHGSGCGHRHCSDAGVSVAAVPQVLVHA